MATSAGVHTTAVERDIPYANDTTKKRGDLLTKVGGQLPLDVSKFPGRRTRLAMDVRLGHTFATANHKPKTKTISIMESEKNAKYREAYKAKGYVFAPLVCDTWGQMGQDLLRVLWCIATCRDSGLKVCSRKSLVS